jgi:hypothetical protein
VKLNPLLQWQRAAFNKKTLFAIKLDLNLRKALVKCYTWSTLLATKNRNVNWIAHILRKNCPLKHVIEGKIPKYRSDAKTRKKTQSATG